MKNKKIIILIIIVIIAIIAIGCIFIFLNNSTSTEENEITESQNYETTESWNNWEESQSTEITNKKIKYDDATLKSEFDNIFTNDIKNYNENYENKKEKSDEDIVYTGYDKNEKLDNSYKVNVKIPYINIKGEIIEKYNKDITKNFERVAEKILSTSGKRYIYEVDYSACFEDDILSLAVKANIQQGDKSRLIIKTYNYNLKEDSEVSVTNVLKLKNRELDYTQNKINDEIKKESQKALELKDLDYNVFERDVESDEYKVENVNTFYLYDGNLYIIFAYGNKNNTIEKDIVIISNSETEKFVENTGKLSQLTSENYGDYIDLGKNLVGDSTTEDDWRILYNDRENGKIYAILSDYLPNSTGIAKKAGLDTDDKYSVFSNKDRNTLLNGFKKNIWNELVSANCQDDIEVRGAVTKEILLASYNEKHNTNVAYNEKKEGDFFDHMGLVLYENPENEEGVDNLYVPKYYGNNNEYHSYSETICASFWLDSPCSIGDIESIVGSDYSGNISCGKYNMDKIGLHPVAILSSDINIEKSQLGNNIVWKIAE